jgi:hypothetical protein
VIAGTDNNKIRFSLRDDCRFEVHRVRLKEKLNRWVDKGYKVLSNVDSRYQKFMKFHHLIVLSSHRLIVSYCCIWRSYTHVCAIDLQRQDVICHEDKIRYIFNRMDNTYLILTKSSHFWWYIWDYPCSVASCYQWIVAHCK